MHPLSRWEPYRSYRVWSQLVRGHGAPPVAELSAFLGGLPLTGNLDDVFPSLRPLRSLRLPWAAEPRTVPHSPQIPPCGPPHHSVHHRDRCAVTLCRRWTGLLTSLGALPALRSCRWLDESGAEHLLLLRRTDAPAAHAEAGGGGSSAGALPPPPPPPPRSGGDGPASGRLVHCKLIGGGVASAEPPLQLRVCSTQPLGDAANASLVCELSEGVANAVACWAFAATSIPVHTGALLDLCTP